MNINDFSEFLAKFDIPEKIIKEFTSAKVLVQLRSNVYLTDKDFEPREIHKDIIMFIRLQRLVPTSYLLNFIARHSPNTVDVNDKQAVDFTYGRDLSFQAMRNNKNRLLDNKYYLLSKSLLLS